MDHQLPLLQARGLSIGYGSGSRNACQISGPLDLAIHAGKMICLLGPNGSGKSTLLRTLSGLQPALAGTIEMGAAGARLSPAHLAKQISLVLTEPVRDNNLTVYALVALGRYPHSNWLGILNDADKAMVRQALDATGMTHYAERKMSTLSDGESQKAMLARALAQDTPLMMLDEPTAHLDLPSRIQLMQLLHQLAGTTGKGILVSTHELDLALQVADQVWLLQAGGRLDTGVPEDLVLNGIFSAAFDKEGIHFDRATGMFRIHPGQLQEIRLDGEGVAVFWTRRALRRKGFSVTDDHASPRVIRVVLEKEQAVWILEGPGVLQRFTSLSGLLDVLSI